MIINIILYCVLFLGITMLITASSYMLSEGKLFNKIYHDYFGWHLPIGRIGFDGLSFCSRCKFCGSRILQDSQGNWFSVE